MDFSKDILISYAHIDDESLTEGQKGWIEEFHRSLDIRLSQLLGEKPRIWRDLKLQGNDFFGDEIVGQFPYVALMVSVLTPRYVKSEWCLKEVNEFTKACEQNIGSRVYNKSRIFKIVKTPVDFNQHPEPIRDVLGYEFYAIDEQSGRPREFGKLFGKDSELAYWAKLDDVAHDITELLQEIKQAEAGEDQASTSEDKIKVYLAEVSSDMLAYRDNIKRELQDHNCMIYPDQPMPLNRDDYSRTVTEMIKECQVAVHLVGNNYGIVPEGTNKSIVVLQNDLSVDQSARSDLKRLIWMPPNLEVEDKRQKDFIEELNGGANEQSGAELLESSIEDFKFTVHNHLEKVREAMRSEPEAEAAAETVAVNDPGAPAMVYLICDQRDLDNISELEDFLFDQGNDVVVPVFEGEESQIRLDHQDNLKACDAVMIYYGEGNELWMRSKHRELMKIAGYGRTTPLECKGVYLAPPHNERKARFRAHDAIIIDGMEGLKAENLAPYLEKLKALKG